MASLAQLSTAALTASVNPVHNNARNVVAACARTGRTAYCFGTRVSSGGGGGGGPGSFPGSGNIDIYYEIVSPDGGLGGLLGDVLLGIGR